jgi:microcystin-dependent protein
MSDPYIGELKLISFNFAPRGWALCNGQLMPINQYQALYSVLGTQYGGDGVTTFALPNMQGRMPIHQGQGFSVGNSGGEATHVLSGNEMPTHNHPALAQSTANTGSPTGAEWAASTEATYASTPSGVMAAGAVSNAGGNQPHENRPPYLVLNWAVALEGIFPSRP